MKNIKSLANDFLHCDEAIKSKQDITAEKNDFLDGKRLGKSELRGRDKGKLMNISSKMKKDPSKHSRQNAKLNVEALNYRERNDQEFPPIPGSNSIQEMPNSKNYYSNSRSYVQFCTRRV